MRVSLMARPTDWNAYYQQPYKTASVTRRITQRYLISALRRYAPQQPVIAELGGANSCFFTEIQRKLAPREYHLIDNNRLGLDLFRRFAGDVPGVFLHQEDVLRMRMQLQADVVLSVGLVEHFPPQGTRAAIEAHFRLLRPGGIALITFPTPTWLYRATRRLAESCGAWIFHDERPLRLDEVRLAAAPFGELLSYRMVWPIMLTQFHVVWRKPDAIRIAA
jgi:SAM-dependent methyltransferase